MGVSLFKIEELEEVSGRDAGRLEAQPDPGWVTCQPTHEVCGSRLAGAAGKSKSRNRDNAKLEGESDGCCGRRPGT